MTINSGRVTERLRRGLRVIRQSLLRQARIRWVILATITLLFGLHVFRVFLPTLLWYLGGFLDAQGLVLFALATFALALLAPTVRGRLGERRSLGLSVGGLALVRLAIQVARAPIIDLALATVGLGLLGWFIPVWCQSRRNCPGRSDVPVLATAFPLAFLIDTGSRSLLLSYDLAWRTDLLPTLTVVGLVVLVLEILRRELIECAIVAPQDYAAEEPALSCVLPLVGLGPWLYVSMTITHNPSALAAATGWGYQLAHLVVNGFTALGALVGVWVAGRAILQRWYLALSGGILMVVSLMFFVAGIGPAWLWVGLASFNSWAALGEVLTSTTRTAPLRPGLWRSGVATFFALATMLTIVVLAIGYDALWITPVAGAILSLAALWATRVDAGRASSAVRTRAVLVGTMAVSVLVVVAVWLVLERPRQIVQMLAEGKPLRIMTYNIHHGIDAESSVDLQAIARVIAAENPDVIALNEVNRARVTNGFVDTLPLISHRLRMQYVFGANHQDGQYGNAVLSRYPILEWENVHYSTKTTETRGLLRVVVQIGDKPTTFFATHLDHIEGPKNVRAEQVTEALGKWGGDPRAILLGDLNAEPDSPELVGIYEAGFLDVLATTGLDDVFTFWEPVPSRRIDFIFLTPDISVDGSWVVPSRASDHLPVLAEVRP